MAPAKPLAVLTLILAVASLTEVPIYCQEVEAVRAAERQQNLQTCLNGRWPTLCNHNLLRPDEKSRVAAAERQQNLNTCLAGRWPTLCNHNLLTASERVNVDQAERRENLKVCLDGRWPTLCNHELLKSSTAKAPGHEESRVSPDGMILTAPTGTFGSSVTRMTSRQETVPVVAATFSGRSANLSKVFVLLVYEKDGLYTSASATEERAAADLSAYVKQKWAVQFPGQPMLQDADALINAFFDQNDEKEGYEILELPLLDDLAASAGQAQADSTKPPTEGATLSISSQPLGAGVFLDGEFRGRTPFKMAVSAGAINIMVLKKGYKAWIRIVNLNPGTSTPFIADLESSR